jgi:exonuclease SbcD
MGLKILHTADWHLGKQLQKIDFSDDMNLFFEWLVNCIKENDINVLLMAGDLFDHANPTQAALHQYYYFLKQLIPLKCKVIITGGNHDSPNVLNAPKELLDILEIHVVGGVPNDISNLFIEINQDNEKVIVAAVPFLREKDIRNAIPGESYQDKVELTKAGIANYFKIVNEYYNENFKGIPFIVMAHLYAKGATVSESEREIQIGNQAGVDFLIFGEEPNYVALGHIHRPQIVSKPQIRYSGSPIPMSFSEKEDTKEVVILELEKEEFKITPVQIDSFRKLITFKGSLAEVKSKLLAYKTRSKLPDIGEVIIQEENESIEYVRALEEILINDNSKELIIIKGKIEFKNKLEGTSSLLNKGEEINDFTAVQLFEKRLEQDESIKDNSEYINAFKEILETINFNEKTI